MRAKVSSWRRIGPDSLIPHAKASGQYLNSVLAKIESARPGTRKPSCSTGTAMFARARARTCSWSGRRDRHPGPLGQHPRRHQPQVRHRDRRRPRLRGRGPRRGSLQSRWPTKCSPARRRSSPVREIDDIEIGPPGPITREIQQAFDDALHGRRNRTPAGWTWCRYHPRRERPRVRANYLDGPQAVHPFARSFPTRKGAPMAEQALLYDTTLRDGMQGEGMSLSVEEKLRVAHALTRLCTSSRPASGLQPCARSALRPPLPGDVRARRDRSLRHDAGATWPPPTIPPCACWPRASRRSAPWWARPGRSTSRRSRTWTPRRTAMIEDSVGFLVGEGKR